MTTTAVMTADLYVDHLRASGNRSLRPLPDTMLWNLAGGASSRRWGRSERSPIGTIRRQRGRDVAVLSSPATGGPAVAAILEILVALEAKRVVTVGSAGSLAEAAPGGTVVVPDRAQRDDGTSLRYAPPSAWATPNTRLADEVRSALRSGGLEPLTGPTWTTDVPFRETRADVDSRSAQGVLTVEMEAAAFFAAADALGIEAAAVLVVADELHSGRWVGDDAGLTRRTIVDALDRLIANLGNVP